MHLHCADYHAVLASEPARYNLQPTGHDGISICNVTAICCDLAGDARD